jgi:hypothetical protein
MADDFTYLRFAGTPVLFCFQPPLHFIGGMDFGTVLLAAFVLSTQHPLRDAVGGGVFRITWIRRGERVVV